MHSFESHWRRNFYRPDQSKQLTDTVAKPDAHGATFRSSHGDSNTHRNAITSANASSDIATDAGAVAPTNFGAQQDAFPGADAGSFSNAAPDCGTIGLSDTPSEPHSDCSSDATAKHGTVIFANDSAHGNANDAVTNASTDPCAERGALSVSAPVEYAHLYPQPWTVSAPVEYAHLYPQPSAHGNANDAVTNASADPCAERGAFSVSAPHLHPQPWTDVYAELEAVTVPDARAKFSSVVAAVDGADAASNVGAARFSAPAGASTEAKADDKHDRLDRRGFVNGEQYVRREFGSRRVVRHAVLQFGNAHRGH